jgi:hypothetical protein
MTDKIAGCFSSRKRKIKKIMYFRYYNGNADYAVVSGFFLITFSSKTADF